MRELPTLLHPLAKFRILVNTYQKFVTEAGEVSEAGEWPFPSVTICTKANIESRTWEHLFLFSDFIENVKYFEQKKKIPT